MFKDFVINDPRKNRATVTVTEESLTNRCEVMLPPSIVAGTNILDYGCALGAMGKWALEHGCWSYDGVEIQDEYRNKAEELLSEYSRAKLYKSIDDTYDQYDIVIAAGVIHGHFNLIDIIGKLCAKSSNYLIIESHLVKGDVPVIEMRTGSMVKFSDINNPFTGIELAPNRPAIDLLMAVNGFTLEEDLYPKPITGSHDAYNINNGNRFIARYKKTSARVKTLEGEINVGV